MGGNQSQKAKPPLSRAPPIATSAIIAIAPATGPLNDCCRRVSGASQGNACPPPAANAGTLRRNDASVSKPVCAARRRHSTLLVNTFISFFSFRVEIHNQQLLAPLTANHPT